MSILKKIKKALVDNLPFVAYRKPNHQNVLGLFQQDDTLYTIENYNEKGFVFAPFDEKKQTVLIPVSFSNLIEEEVMVEDEKNIDSVFDVDDVAKDFHIEIVEKGIEAIKEGCFKKVVLSRKEIVNRDKIEIVDVFKNLLSLYKNACVYLWYHPKVGLWMGATPETLIKIKDNCFETMSLAGTQVYDSNRKVEWEAKEIEEQQLVTDYVLQKLKSVCKTVKASKVETIKAGDLLHLKTIIQGELNSNPSELIHVLHPTPAVCGFPKNESKYFIFNNEGYDREFYTGFLGELNMPNSELFVNLRCMQVKESTVDVYVGGGITKDSNPLSEWLETVAKAKTMKRVL